MKLIIAGGGTGGHLFPGIAVAKELLRSFHDADVLFVTGGRKMEERILSRAGFRHCPIKVEGLKGKGWAKKFGGMMKLPLGFFQSLFILRGFSPTFVLGVGGYASGPVCLAARVMGIPSAIHEQNSFPGLTNRLLCRVVDKVFISFEQSRRYFSRGDICFTGNPVREEILEARGDRRPGDGRDITVLVMGGSQGAKAINSAFLEGLKIMKAQGKTLPHIIHQTGDGDYERVKGAYGALGVKGDIRPFFEDMASVYAAADIVLSRAGATTVSELATLGKPSILVPYPHAANRHQDVNASMLERVGGALVVPQRELTGGRLVEIFSELMKNRGRLSEMGRNAKTMGVPDASKRILECLLAMSRGVQ